MLILVGIALFLGFITLGVWQVQRRAWKLDLMARVEQRVHAAPVPAPAAPQWPHVDAIGYEYLPVTLTGQWLDGKTVLTQAATELGAGFWVLTPLQQADGSQVLVNRGFVPQAQRVQWLPAANAAPTAPAAAGTPPATVQGLLRISEPHGGFLRTNDPVQQRWYSRDVPAIAAAQGLDRAAPYFVDAGLPDLRTAAQPEPSADGPWPRAGLTVVRFHNSHAVYALTWFGLALMVVGAAGVVARYEQRQRAAGRDPSRHEPQR